MQASNATPRGSKASKAAKSPVKVPETPPPKPQGRGKGKGKIIANVSPVKPINTASSGPRMAQTVKAGLQFSVPRVARFMKQGRYTDRIGGGAPIYLTAALQYICSEIIELAGNEAQ